MGSLCVAQHFEFILKTMRARRCLEIGCGVGYTALTLAMSLPDNGEVVTLDIESTEDQARQIWRESGHGHKVRVMFYQQNIIQYFKQIKFFSPSFL